MTPELDTTWWLEQYGMTRDQMYLTVYAERYGRTPRQTREATYVVQS